MEKELNWAVIGTGVIANEMAQALQKTDKTLYGVANRTQRLLILQRSMVLKKSMMKLMMCLMMKMLILFIWQHHIIRIINL